jgi:hypothetical protein
VPGLPLPLSGTHVQYLYYRQIQKEGIIVESIRVHYGSLLVKEMRYIFVILLSFQERKLL